MNFSRHAFISYAHEDDDVLPPAEYGWVTNLRAALTHCLRVQVGNEVDIWWDKKNIGGNTAVTPEILEQFSQTAALVPVFSPSYLNSGWCDLEINGFNDAAKDNGGVVVGTRSRIFKVIKFPIEDVSGLPDIVSDTPGYEFYEVDAVDSIPHTIDPSFDPQQRRSFIRKVEKLAFDMKKVLDRLRGVVPGDCKPHIYLAECSSDRRADRDAIETELANHGYVVLPDEPLPRNEEDYRAEVARAMAQCRLSVHLVGSGRGLVPDGPSGKSVVELQNEIAVDTSRRGSLARVISLPAGTKSDKPAQQEFIDRLHDDPDKQFAADLITGGLQEVKSVVLAALTKIETPVPVAVSQEKDAFIFCTECERFAAAPLIRFLKSRNVAARLPLFNGDEARRHEANREMLVNADAVILFYGANDELWKHDREREIAAARGSMARVFTYLADPMSDDKNVLLAIGGADLIDGRADVGDRSFGAVLEVLERK